MFCHVGIISLIFSLTKLLQNISGVEQRHVLRSQNPPSAEECMRRPQCQLCAAADQFLIHTTQVRTCPAGVWSSRTQTKVPDESADNCIQDRHVELSLTAPRIVTTASGNRDGKRIFALHNNNSCLTATCLRGQASGCSSLAASAFPLRNSFHTSSPCKVVEGFHYPSMASCAAYQCTFHLESGTKFKQGDNAMQVQGVRVEVNGQVLSQGGDTQADQIEDTSSATIARNNGGFLPAAVIIGLIPGVPTPVSSQ